MSTLSTIRQKQSKMNKKQVEGVIKSIENQKNKTPAIMNTLNLWTQVYNELFNNTDNDGTVIYDENKPFQLMAAEKYVNKYKNAISRGIVFNLTIGDIKKLLRRKTCAYTGVELTINNRTIERFNNNEGYIKGNVFAVTKEANQAKNRLLENSASDCLMTFDQLKRMVNKLDIMGWE